MKFTFNKIPPFLARPTAGLAAVAALVFLAPGGPVFTPVSYAQEAAAEDMEVLTRGPVHEAFAGTITFKATPGIVVTQMPPALIEELPPDQRPDGDNVTWIPGYWAWDDESSDFLWVSGIWRNLPPGRQWIPGYWWESGQEHQWISGYWADAEEEEVVYLSEPPASIEAGPNVDAPSKNHTWIPGTWRWQEDRYAWQPGYWYEAQPDWVWVPSYYSSTPRGYVYVDGYYDYEVARRGVIFAPVRFNRGYAARPDYRYRPETVISLSVFVDHLFLRPKNRHYYFGDYYAPRYRESGYLSSYNYYSTGNGYDPIYAHQRWTHREDRNWERQHVERYNYFREHENARPPHTLAAFTRFLAQPDRDRRVENSFASDFRQSASRKDGRIQWREVGDDEKKNFSQRSRAIREFAEERRKQGNAAGLGPRDEKGRDGRDGSRKESPVRQKLAKSPVLARLLEGEGKDKSPPRRPNAALPGNRDNRPDGRGGPGKNDNRPDKNDGRDTPRNPERPDTSRPGNDRPGNDKPGNDKPGNDRPDENRPDKNKPGKDRPDKNRPDTQPGDRKEDPRPGRPEMPKVEPKERPREMPQPERKERPSDMPDPRRNEADRERKNPPTPDRSNNQPDVKPDRENPNRPDRSDSRPKATPQPDEPRRDSKPDVVPQPPRRDSKPEPRRETPKPEVRQERKEAPRRESKPDAPRPPKAEPSSPEPRRERKAEPAKQERKQPQPERKKESRPEPKPSPQPVAQDSRKGGKGSGDGEKKKKD